MVAWGGNHFTPLLPMYERLDGYSTVTVDTFLAFYIVGLIPGFLFLGPISDRIGRKRLTLVGLALSIVASCVLAVGSAHPIAMDGGRLLVGVSVAMAMVAGTSWIAEISASDSGTSAAGSRRSSVTLSLGFGIGAATSGALAQWGPAPTVMPYAVYIGLALAAGTVLLRAPETRSHNPRARSFFGDLKLSGPVRRRFLTLVAPSAPWVFGAAGLAYVVTPSLLAHSLGDRRVGFATLFALLTLGSGAAIQPFGDLIGRLTRGRQLVAGMALIVVATGLCIVESIALSVPLAIVIAIIFGFGYGLCLVSGLTEIKRLDGPDDLAGLTGIYGSLTYIGFLLPVILASASSIFPYWVLLSVVAVLSIASLLQVARTIDADVPREIRPPSVATS